MPRYSDEFKEQVVRKMMPPDAQSVAQVHRETGISEPTLYAWRNRFRAEGQVVPADPSNPESWSGENKLAVVIETAALNEQELVRVITVLDGLVCKLAEGFLAQRREPHGFCPAAQAGGRSWPHRQLQFGLRTLAPPGATVRSRPATDPQARLS